jgi:hypothetical protein
MERVEVDIRTGERRVIRMTDGEIRLAMAATAAEARKRRDPDHASAHIRAMLKAIAGLTGKPLDEVHAAYSAALDEVL